MVLYRAFGAAPIKSGPHDVAPADEGAEAFVRDAEIGDGWLHPGASNATFIVELALGATRGLGVYKPRSGEAPLWDFPAGTLHRRECAAYVLSRLLGWSLVPPTVLREGQAGIGSLQLFVPAAGDSNFFTLREEHPDETLRMAVFDVVANNADRKGGHCFMGPDGGVWGLDHGLTFNLEPKLRTVIWDHAGSAVPDGLLRDLRRLDPALRTEGSDADARLGALLAPDEMDALRSRLGALIERPVLPTGPHSRRDLPWPWL
ncbi:MAG: SCO1664 family protein [Chloroflexi bacterium]|nr:SCO1664 family protein [Chloroflexota bacterium]